MKITFLGTGAADWEPDKRMPGDFFRRKTTALVNDDLMIDISPDVPDFLAELPVSPDDVENIILTHSHDDHYSPESLERLFGEKGVNVWADKGALNKIISLPKIIKKAVSTFCEQQAGRYKIIALPANHSVSDTDEQPLHYIISDGEKTLFWGCDGAWLLNSTWHEMRKHTFDMIVFDGTLFDVSGDYRIFEHNNLKMIIEMAATIRNAGLVKENGKIYISHMSKYAQYPHGELEKYLAEYDIHAAYDGLEIEI